MPLYNIHVSFFAYSVQAHCRVDRNGECSEFCSVRITDVSASKFSSLQAALHHATRPIILISHLQVSLSLKKPTSVSSSDSSITKDLCLDLSFFHNLENELACLLP